MRHHRHNRFNDNQPASHRKTDSHNFRLICVNAGLFERVHGVKVQVKRRAVLTEPSSSQAPLQLRS